MFKHLLGASVLAFLSVGSAHAANCPAYPYNLTNGTTADANQVMGDFNAIQNCANNNLAPVANPRLTGTVGIGTSTPGTTLDVVGGIRTASNFFGPQNGQFGIYTDIGASTGAAIQFFGPGGTAPNTLTFLTGSTLSERMRITATGNIGIGTGTPSSLFYVNGTAGGTSAWSSPSDARLKKNVQPISGGLSLITRLNPVSYDWRLPKERSVGKSLTLPTDEHQVGFIAQEVEKVVPEAVTKPQGSDGIYSLKQENLIPVLVAAIKEQQAEIEQLKARLATLAPAPQH